MGLACQRVHGGDRGARRRLIGGAAAHLRAEAKRRARRSKAVELRQRTAGAVGGDLRFDGVAASRRERLDIRDRLLELRVREDQRVGERRVADLQVLALDFSGEPARLRVGASRRAG